MNLKINEDSLTQEQIKEHSKKVRAIIIDENNNILIANYGGTYLFPGGKIDKNEDELTAIKRELQEETGVLYTDDDLLYMTTLEYYQPNYEKINKTKINRMITTHYYIAKSKGIDDKKIHLTNREIKDNFHLETIPLGELEQKLINNPTDNPRNKYFKVECLTILKEFIKTIKKDDTIMTLTKKYNGEEE